MRALLLTGDQANQRALANKLTQVCELTGIVLSGNIPRRRPDARMRLHAFVSALAMRTFGGPLRSAWLEMQRSCEAQYPSFPHARQIVRVDNVNDPATLDLVSRLSPDLILVSGTNLVGKRLIDACHGTPILNLHTGISPYVKGGPNCTNWCLAEGLFHLIGSTVMWLDAGIDSGDVVASERTPLSFRESLGELHVKVMEHAHDLYVRSVQRVASAGPLPRVSQSQLGEGRTYLTKEWNSSAIRRAVQNFANLYSPTLLDQSEYSRLRDSIRILELSPTNHSISPGGS